MKISSRLTVAAHTLLCIAHFKEEKATSEWIAGSVGVHPVVIRRILGELKAAGLVDVARGSGGATLKAAPEDITLLDVYRAVECVQGDLFHFHENPCPDCPVGKSVHAVLRGRLAAAQQALESSLAGVTLAELAAGIEEDAR